MNPQESPQPVTSGDGADVYSSVSGSGPPIVLLHGLFGMGSNLGGIARDLADHFEVHQLDLPNHGRSAWTEGMTLDDLAAAVQRYVELRCRGRAAVLGHSLGGKAAMQWAINFPASVTGLVVADIAPITYPSSHGAVFAAIDAVSRAAPRSRSQAREVLQQGLEEDAVAQFLLLNLRRDSDGVYRWRFNVSALAANYEEIRAAPRGNGYQGDTLFVYGANSNYVVEEGLDAARRLFPGATYISIADTGHWLHVEKPAEFNQAVRSFLLALETIPGGAA